MWHHIPEVAPLLVCDATYQKWRHVTSCGVLYRKQRHIPEVASHTRSGVMYRKWCHVPEVMSCTRSCATYRTYQKLCYVSEVASLFPQVASLLSPGTTFTMWRNFRYMTPLPVHDATSGELCNFQHAGQMDGLADRMDRRKNMKSFFTENLIFNGGIMSSTLWWKNQQNVFTIVNSQ